MGDEKKRKHSDRLQKKLQSDEDKAFIQSSPETSGMNEEEILLKYNETSKKLIQLCFVLL